LFDNTIDGLSLKLGGAVCLSSAKLLRIIFPTSIVRISANFYFYIQNEKLENKKNHQEDKGTTVLESHRLSQSLEKQ